MIAADDDSLQACQEAQQRLICPYCTQPITDPSGACCGEIGHGFNMAEFEEYFDEQVR